jgi:probable F420-dependent oxidoreductase
VPHADARFAVTVPLARVPLPEHRDTLHRLFDAGYSDFWTQEVRGHDALVPLAALAGQAPVGARFGASIAGVFTRGPALLAMETAAVAEALPGRVVIGLGSSSDTIVTGWNGVRFERPYARVRDTLRVLRRAHAGERVDEAFESFTLRGFRLERPPPVPPPLFVAALRPRMLQLAASEGDGVCLSLLAPDDVATVLAEARSAGEVREAFLRVAVFAIPDAEEARRKARKLVAPYLAAGPYAAFHRWLGRGEAIARIQERFGAGDKEGALAALPDAIVDGVVVLGTPEACREKLARFVEAGVTTLGIDLLAWEGDWLAAQRALRPV